MEVHRTRRRHAIFFCQQHLSPQPSNGARHGRNDDLVQAVDDLIAGEHQNRAAIIGETKRIPSDLAPNQWNSSQPSASHASVSSSPENSSSVGGATLQAEASVPRGKAIHRSSLIRSLSGRDATRLVVNRPRGGFQPGARRRRIPIFFYNQEYEV
jgi:hypothetical protein